MLSNPRTPPVPGTDPNDPHKQPPIPCAKTVSDALLPIVNATANDPSARAELAAILKSIALGLDSVE